MPERQIVKRAKRTREHTRGGSSISPPSKRAIKATKKQLQPPISEWLTDDEIVCSHAATEEVDDIIDSTPPPHTQESLPPTQHTVAEILSPIMSQPAGSADRNTPRGSILRQFLMHSTWQRVHPPYAKTSPHVNKL